jgi:hypothetical protein
MIDRLRPVQHGSPRPTSDLIHLFRIEILGILKEVIGVPMITVLLLA